MENGPTAGFGFPFHIEVQFILAERHVQCTHDQACPRKFILEDNNHEMTSEYLNRWGDMFLCAVLHAVVLVTCCAQIAEQYQ